MHYFLHISEIIYKFAVVMILLLDAILFTAVAFVLGAVVGNKLSDKLTKWMSQ